MNCGAMLNAYPDSMGGKLGDIVALLSHPECKGAFRSFYILPSVFNTDLDRGFSVISYDLNRQMASEDDLEQLRAAGIDLKLDFILNHLSVLSPQFQDILQRGRNSAYWDFFIDWNAFWQGHGTMTEEGCMQPDPEMLRDMFFRKPGLPLLMVRLPDGSSTPFWNTFYQQVSFDPVDAQDLMRVSTLQYAESEMLAGRINTALADGKKPAEIDLSDFPEARDAVVALLESRCKYLGQMDLNLHSEKVWQYYAETLHRLAGYGASIVRLDAFAYAAKAPGRRNFLNEPETWETLEAIRRMAAKDQLELLPEIHASYSEGTYRRIAELGYATYDFFLPGLVIDALENQDATALVSWATELHTRGIRTVNMLGCHDGIPMLDLQGMIPETRIQKLIDLIVSRGGLIKNLHGQKNVYYQVNATYYSALGEDDRKMLLARALQLFMPGKPQIWYLDLFAGKNDMDAVARGGAAGHKEINRTNLTTAQLEDRLTWPLVQSQLALLKAHNTCPAFGFDAQLEVYQPELHQVTFTWKARGATATLHANLCTMAFDVTADTEDGHFHFRQG